MEIITFGFLDKTKIAAVNDCYGYFQLFFTSYTAKLSPHPQLLLALGLLK